jgi:hypothetical protein
MGGMSKALMEKVAVTSMALNNLNASTIVSCALRKR